MNFFKKSLGGGKTDTSTTASNGKDDEDALDKAVDFFQGRVFGMGSQDKESAAEQKKDEQISDGIRSIYSRATGSELPIKDKTPGSGPGAEGKNPGSKGTGLFGKMDSSKNKEKGAPKDSSDEGEQVQEDDEPVHHEEQTGTEGEMTEDSFYAA